MKKPTTIERARSEARKAAYSEVASMLPDDKMRFIAEAWIEGFLAGMAAQPYAAKYPVHQVKDVLTQLALLNRNVNGELAPF